MYAREVISPSGSDEVEMVKRGVPFATFIPSVRLREKDTMPGTVAATDTCPSVGVTIRPLVDMTLWNAPG